MTEDEAKTKWCFAAVASHTDPRGGFREDDSPHTYRQFPCIGSACMAWRRRTVLIDRATLEPARPGVASVGALEERFSAEGFCGLAGAPL